MHTLSLCPFALALALGVTAAGPPCGAERPIAICAEYIRPYSDNAYFWENVCDLSASPNALIADSIEFYDFQYGWYAVIDVEHPTHVDGSIAQ